MLLRGDCGRDPELVEGLASRWRVSADATETADQPKLISQIRCPRLIRKGVALDACTGSVRSLTPYASFGRV